MLRVAANYGLNYLTKSVRLSDIVNLSYLSQSSIKFPLLEFNTALDISTDSISFNLVVSSNV